MDIHESVEKILRSQQMFGDAFYEVFFRRFPDMQTFFQTIDMKRQSLVLTLAMSIIAQYYSSGYPATEKYLEYLGTQHKKRGIPREAYDKWREAMIDTLARFHGDQWSEELKSEWNAAFDRCVSVMFHGYDQYFVV